VVNKALLASLPPLTLLFLELASSVTALWAILSFSRVQLPPPLLLWPIVALGVLNPGIVYALALMGLARVSASVTTLLWAAEPAMILTLAAVMLREPVSSRLLMVMAVGFVGVLLVADLAGGGDSGQNSPSGVVLLLLAVLCCAFYTVLSRALSGSADPLAIVAIQQTAGLAWTAALLAARFDNTGMSDVIAIPTSQLATAALAGLMYYAIAYWLYLTALRFVPAAVAGAYFNAIPVFGVGLAIVFLGESLTTLQWAGAVAVMLSVAGLANLTSNAGAKPIGGGMDGRWKARLLADSPFEQKAKRRDFE